MSDHDDPEWFKDLRRMVEDIQELNEKSAEHERTIKSAWDMKYKTDESFAKRLTAIEQQIISLNELVSELSKKFEDNDKVHLWFRGERDRILEQHVRQVDENRKVDRILEELQIKVKALCKTEEMRWRNGYAQFMKDLTPEGLE